MTTHQYQVDLQWDGNTGTGTTDHEHYDRRFRVRIAGKPELIGSADPTFRGEASRHNPEDLLVASIVSCHMLSYLALCARHGVSVVEYRDSARGVMRTDPGGGGRFETVVLHPHVMIAAGHDAALARTLHDRAHATCFIASSCRFPITCEPEIEHAAIDHAGPPPVVRSDLAVRLPNRPGALAELGEILGRAGVSLEGGGGFAVGDHCIVRFLVAEPERARAALQAACIEVLGVRDVLVQRLDQETPGQLGKLARAMADGGVNIDCVYSDHDHALILCVDDPVAGRQISEAWRT